MNFIWKHIDSLSLLSLSIAIIVFGKQAEFKYAAVGLLIGIGCFIYEKFFKTKSDDSIEHTPPGISNKEKSVETEALKEFEKIAEQNASIIEKCYAPVGYINVIKGATVGLKDSKFGGQPYWTEGKEYPRNAGGESLAMIAQINCKDVPSFLGWPEQGIVQFFIHSSDDCLMGMDLAELNNQDAFRIVYHENIDLENVDNDLDINSEYLPFDVSKALKIEITAGRMLPSAFMDYLNPKLAKLIESNEDGYEAYREIKNKRGIANQPEHQIGGYPSFVQADPRDESQAKTRYANLLLQIDTDDDNNISWGDCGTAQFLTSTSKLKKRNFTDVLYEWACC